MIANPENRCARACARHGKIRVRLTGKSIREGGSPLHWYGSEYGLAVLVGLHAAYLLVCRDK